MIIKSAIPAAYNDCDGRDAALDEAAHKAGGSVIEFSHSICDQPLRAALFPSTSSLPSSSLPTVLVNGNLHGLEWIGAQACLGTARALGGLAGAPLRRRAHVVVAPCLNPDGAKRTEAQGGRGTIKELRTNANGVDLNRNFPLPHGAKPFFLEGTGSSDPSSPTYRGTAPFSEVETRAVDALAADHRFHAVVSFHSFMGTVIPPKVTTSREAATYRRLGRAFRRGQTRFSALTLMCAPLDVFTGELEDHLHHVHRAWSLTVEIFPFWRSFAQHLRAPSIFNRFNPDDPRVYVDDAVGGCLAFLDAALDLERP